MNNALLPVEVLIREINKIVSAPYTVPLKTLSHILKKIDASEIYLWTVIKQCQLSVLVWRVLRGLHEDQTALPILLKLLQNRSIRDEVIRQDCTILGNLFSKVSDEKILAICMTLCKYPFPEDFAPSPEYFDFAAGILSNAREESVNVWIARLYDLLLNMEPVSFSTFEDVTMRKCINHWNEASKTTESATFIRFLSVAALIKRTQMVDSSYSSCDSSPASKIHPLTTWRTKCSDLFSPQKAPKILKSILLRMLFFVSEKATIATSELISCFEMIRLVVNTINEDILYAALQDQEAIQVFIKIVQKSTQTPFPVTVRLCIASVLINLDPGHQWWDVNFLHNAMGQLTQDQLQLNSVPHPSDMAKLVKNLKFQADHSDLFLFLGKYSYGESAVVQELVQHLIGWCRPGMYTNIESTCRIQAATMFLEVLTEAMGSMTLQRDDTSQAVATVIPEWWNWNFGGTDSTSNCQQLVICSQTKNHLQQDLARQISSTILMSACMSCSRLDGTSFRVLQDVMRRPENPRQCSWPREPSRKSECEQISTFTTLLTKNILSKHELEQTLIEMNMQTSTLIDAYIDDVCCDLQRRCDTIEEPLAAERAKSEKLRIELNELRNSVDLLLADHQARNLSWQHELDLERKENTMLRQQQVNAGHDMQTLATQLKEISEQSKLANIVKAELEVAL